MRVGDGGSGVTTMRNVGRGEDAAPPVDLSDVHAKLDTIMARSEPGSQAPAVDVSG